MSTLRRRTAAAGAVALLLPAALAAQEGSARGLSLGDAVGAALQENRAILGARLGTEDARAEVLRTRGAYDTRVRTTLSDTRRETSSLDAAGELKPDVLSSRTSSYDFRLVRELPGGLVVQPGLNVARTDDPQSLAMPFTRAGASVNVVAPLGANRGGWLTRTAVRDAELGSEAAEHELRQSAASSIRDVVSAYWEYRAAHQRRAALATAEARAARLLDETRTLVAAEERPAADLIQLQANLASKRMTRLNGEHQVEVARQRMGLLMGMDAAEAGRLPEADEPFPAARPFHGGAPEIERLVALAAEHRPELAAASLRARSAELQAAMARAQGRPGVDLTVEVGYSGLTTAEGFGGALSPLYRDIPGLNVTLQLSYQAALADGAARGRAVRGAAAVERQRLAGETAREQVASGVMLAAAALERSLLQLQYAGEAVRLFGTAVDNEKAKYALGTATLFDVIQAEDNLTSALLSEADAQLGHATALARLRWETGTLLAEAGPDLRFTPELATTRP